MVFVLYILKTLFYFFLSNLKQSIYNKKSGLNCTFNDYWTLPISEKETNDKVIDIIRYDSLDNK